MAGEPDSNAPKKTSAPGWLMALLVVAVVGVAGYALYSGGALEKASIPGWLEFQFSAKPGAPARPVASRDFVLGQWEVEQTAGANAGGTRLIYYQDGTVKGWQTQFANGAGLRQPWSGTWRFDRIIGRHVPFERPRQRRRTSIHLPDFRSRPYSEPGQ